MDFFDFEWRSTFTQTYAAWVCQWSLTSETLNKFLVRTISFDGTLMRPTLAGLLPISGVQKQSSCSYCLTPSRVGVAGAHSKSMIPSIFTDVLSNRFIRGNS